MLRPQISVLLFLVLAFGFAAAVPAQDKPLLKRTTFKTDKLDFGAGGTLSIVGAPNGSIRIEGWQNREVEISATVELQAPTEAGLARLSEVTTFATDESLGRTGIISLGTHDKQYMKRVIKNFPKELLSMPFRIDYVIKVPRYCDIQVDGGRGDLEISGVEGTFKLNFLETHARLELTGGATNATFGVGTVDVTVPSANWRGRFAEIQLASGKMTVSLPAGLNAEVDATILRSGRIDNGFPGLKPRVRKAAFTERSIEARSGIGGIDLRFTVGDGTLTITETKKPG